MPTDTQKAYPQSAANEGRSYNELLKRLGLEPVSTGAFCGEWMAGGGLLESVSPIDGSVLAQVNLANLEQSERVIERAESAINWGNAQEQASPGRSEEHTSELQ